MKKRAFFLLTLCLIAALLCTAVSAAESPKTMTLRRIADGAIKVDGVMDDLYKIADKQDMVEQNLDYFSGSFEDATGVFYAVYDSSNIYLFVDITDLEEIDYTAGPVYNRDCLGVMLDFSYIRTEQYLYSYADNGDLICYINLAGDNEKETYHMYANGADTGLFDKIQHATNPGTADKHILYEIAMPIPEQVKVADGMKIGFEVIEGEAFAGSKYGCVSWSPEGSEMWHYTDVCGTAIFEDNGTIYNVAAAPADAASADVLQTIHIDAMDYVDCGACINSEFQTGVDGVATALSLKPTDASAPLDCYYDFDVTIDQDCEAVDINFTYSTSGVRHMQATFNGETQVIDCPDTTAFNIYSTLTATFGGVKAGKYTLRIGAPEAYADDFKTPNIDLIDIAARNGSVSAFAGGTAPAEEAPAAAEAPAEAAPAGYPSSGFTPKDGSAIITGEIIGLENGWDGTAACGRVAAFDGDINTFFDPLGTGDGWAGIDAGSEYTLTAIVIHPRTTFLDRFNGGTIEGSMDPEFENAVTIWSSMEAASAIEWQIIDQSDFDEVGSFRYYRYINWTNHGDVGDVELYGYPSDGEYEAQEAARQEAAAKAAEEAAAKKAEAEAAKAAEAEAKAAEEAAKAAEEAAAAAAEAEAAAEAPAEAPAAAEKSGCGSFIGGGMIVLVSILGCGWLVRRKD